MGYGPWDHKESALTLKYDLVDNSLETGCFRNSFILQLHFARSFLAF